jgi:hypothetical protein
MEILMKISEDENTSFVSESTLQKAVMFLGGLYIGYRFHSAKALAREKANEVYKYPTRESINKDLHSKGGMLHEFITGALIGSAFIGSRFGYASILIAATAFVAANEWLADKGANAGFDERPSMFIFGSSAAALGSNNEHQH